MSETRKRGSLVRMNTFMTPDRAEQMQKWADELGMNMSQFIAVTSWMGAERLVKALREEKEEKK